MADPVQSRTASVLRTLRLPLLLTRLGMVAEQVVRNSGLCSAFLWWFWPP